MFVSFCGPLKRRPGAAYLLSPVSQLHADYELPAVLDNCVRKFFSDRETARKKLHRPRGWLPRSMVVLDISCPPGTAAALTLR